MHGGIDTLCGLLLAVAFDILRTPIGCHELHA